MGKLVTIMCDCLRSFAGMLFTFSVRMGDQRSLIAQFIFNSSEGTVGSGRVI